MQLRKDGRYGYRPDKEETCQREKNMISVGTNCNVVHGSTSIEMEQIWETENGAPEWRIEYRCSWRHVGRIHKRRRAERISSNNPLDWLVQPTRMEGICRRVTAYDSSRMNRMKLGNEYGHASNNLGSCQGSLTFDQAALERCVH